MALKSQDVFVVLKLVAIGHRPSYARLSAELGMSASEVHASVRRAEASQLLQNWKTEIRPNLAALEEFLVHGLRYAFPLERGEPTLGVPTSSAAEPICGMLAPAGNEPPPVWPYAKGTRRGVTYVPLYKTAPVAALRDPSFYEYLVLADALRDTRARERTLAKAELHRRFRKAYAGIQS